MRIALASLFTTATIALAGEWRIAAPGWEYAFPRDHHAHAEFRTEWWYFTGNLADDRGARYGFELTFFREGVRPPNDRAINVSRFVVNDLKFAHFTVTDVNGRAFHFDQRVSRGAFGEAGFDERNRIAWVEDWELRSTDDGAFELRARTTDAEIQLTLRAGKPFAIHGIEGISQKGAAAENASHYYSGTRMTTSGTIRIGARSSAVHGDSWFDHEWATNQLGPQQVGWDWLCAQFADGRELMLYRMRLKDGSVDPASSGTIIDASGATIHLTARDFAMTPVRTWKSSATGAAYPIEWRVEIPSAQLQFNVKPALDAQELALKPLTYWEGAVDVSGENVAGRGYLELTGYAAPLEQLQR